MGKLLIQGKQFIDFPDSLSAYGFGRFFLGNSRWNGIYKVPAGVYPTESMSLAGNLLITSIAVRLQNSRIPFEELSGKTAVSAGVIFVNPNLTSVLHELAIGIHPHVRLGLVLPAFFIQYLDWRFVCMDYRLFQKLCVHAIYQRHKPVFC